MAEKMKSLKIIEGTFPAKRVRRKIWAIISIASIPDNLALLCCMEENKLLLRGTTYWKKELLHCMQLKHDDATRRCML